MADIFELQCPCNEFQFTDPEDSFESWNGLRGPAGPAGPPGAPGPAGQLRGPVPSTADLPTTAPSGELWLVGSASPYDGWFYNGSSWQDAGQIAVGPAGPAGADGTTFTPAVSSAGVISWTNDGGKTNPDPVNIKGPQGDPGSAGAPGAAGSDGTTFTPAVSAAGVISWTNDGGKANPNPVNIKGPQGDPGSAGAPGAAATIAVGTVSSLPAGSTPTVVNSGSNAAAVFDFGIPAGATGPQGAAGPGVAAGGSAGQVLAKASGTDYDTEWIDPPSGGGDWTLLWTNASPTSNFPAQTVTLDLTNYKMIGMLVRMNTAADTVYDWRFFSVGEYSFIRQLLNSGSSLMQRYRANNILTSGIVFEDCIDTTQGSTGRTNNGGNIPVKIIAR